MAKYNGHKNWAHWNVALWIANDETLYRMACEYIREARDHGPGALDRAARHIMTQLPPATPDGARYSFTTVRAALVGLVD